MMAGQLRHKIQFQNYTGREAPSGQILKDNWTTYATKWASIEPLNSREYFNAVQAQSEISHKIKCHWFNGVDADHRIMFGDRIFEISGKPRNINELNREMELMAIERTR